MSDLFAVENGSSCYRCRNLASYLYPPGHPVLCYSCKALDSDPDEVSHDDLVRCPKCGHLDKISDWDCDSNETKYSEGEHEVYCSECDHRYAIETHCSYSYTSPPRLDKETA